MEARSELSALLAESKRKRNRKALVMVVGASGIALAFY